MWLILLICQYFFIVFGKYYYSYVYAWKGTTYKRTTFCGRRNAYPGKSYVRFVICPGSNMYLTSGTLLGIILRHYINFILSCTNVTYYYIQQCVTYNGLYVVLLIQVYNISRSTVIYTATEVWE
jgi:hypothetical protein